MNIRHAMRHTNRADWLLAAASFLLVAAGSFAGLRVAYKSSLQKSLNSETKVTSNASNLEAQLRKDQDNHERVMLFQKLAMDNQRLDLLEKERKTFSHSLAGKAGDVQSGANRSSSVANEDEVKKQLYAALVQLLLLEKRESVDDPEIRAEREQITTLQNKIARLAAGPSIVAAPLAQPEKQTQLTQIDAQIDLCGREIIADLQALTPVTTAMQAAEAGQSQESGQSRLSGQEFELNELQDRASLSSKSRFQWALGRDARPHLNNALLLAISVALGFVFSIGTAVLSVVFDKSIRDEELLRSSLPATAEYIGSVPRMKTS